MPSFHDAEHRVLSTLNADGSRRWLRPWVSVGRFLRRRRVVAYALIAVFTLVPYLKMRGQPIVLLDILRREFTFFGTTFFPTDTLALALLVVLFVLSIILVTALLGRVWCGWACPQTVYLEFIYRPIERLFEGKPGRKAKPGAWRKPAKVFVYLLVSMFLAHTFLAYFVGIDKLFFWVRSSPFEHPTAFVTMALVTGLMMFDFVYFREQVCLVACPYGRLQAVMIDRDSLIISYDTKRGETRGRKRRTKPQAKGMADVSLAVLADDATTSATDTLGDCIDCKMCVTTCPTGIDIRDGLQMECIGCAQCIDACDAVMDKVGRPCGLIRYSSQAAMEGGRTKMFRPRVAIYMVLLVGLVGAVGFVLATRSAAYIMVLRGPGSPYSVIEDGAISSSLRVKIRNRTRVAAFYHFEIEGLPGARVESLEMPLVIGPGDMRSEIFAIITPRSAFIMGHAEVTLRITDEKNPDLNMTRRYRLLGPFGPAPVSPGVTGQDKAGDGTSGGDGSD